MSDYIYLSTREEFDDIELQVRNRGKLIPENSSFESPRQRSKQDVMQLHNLESIRANDGEVNGEGEHCDTDLKNKRSSSSRSYDRAYSTRKSGKGPTSRSSVLTQDSGVDEALDESDLSNRGHLSPQSQCSALAKTSRSMSEKAFERQLSPIHRSSSRGRPLPTPKPKLRASPNFGSPSGNTDSPRPPDFMSREQSVGSTAQTVAAHRAKAEALEADRLREREEALMNAQQMEEAARERARQLREMRQRDLRVRDEERRKRVAARKKMFEELEMERKVASLKKRQPLCESIIVFKRSKSARVLTTRQREQQKQYQPHGFASDLDPKDPRYCPFGFGSASRREVCLPLTKVINKENIAYTSPRMTISFRKEPWPTSFRASKRMSQSAMVLRSNSNTSRKPSKFHEPTKSASVRISSGPQSGTPHIQRRKTPIEKIAPEARAPQRSIESVEVGSKAEQTKASPNRASKSQQPVMTPTTPAKSSAKITTTPSNPTYSKATHSSAVKKHGTDRRKLSHEVQETKPRRVVERYEPSRRPSSLLKVDTKERDDSRNPVTQHNGIQKQPTCSPSYGILSPRSNNSEQDAGDIYRTRMLAQRRAAREKREREENLAHLRQAEAAQMRLASLARQTVNEAIACAVAELKAEAIEAAVQSSKEQPESSVVTAAASFLERQQRGSLDGHRGFASLKETNRSYSIPHIQTYWKDSEYEVTPMPKCTLTQALITSQETLNRGLERMMQSNNDTAIKSLQRSQSQLMEILSNAASEAAEREERKMRLDRIMNRFHIHSSTAATTTNAPAFNFSLTQSRSELCMEGHGSSTGQSSPCFSNSPAATPLMFKPNALQSVLESGRLPQNSKAATLLRNKLKIKLDEAPVRVHSAPSQPDTEDELEHTPITSDSGLPVVTTEDIDIDNPAMISSNIEINRAEETLKRTKNTELFELDPGRQRFRQSSPAFRIGDLFPLDEISDLNHKVQVLSPTPSATSHMEDGAYF